MLSLGFGDGSTRFLNMSQWFINGDPILRNNFYPNQNIRELKLRSADSLHSSNGSINLYLLSPLV